MRAPIRIYFPFHKLLPGTSRLQLTRAITVLVFLLMLAPVAALAQTDEIQVYDAGIAV